VIDATVTANGRPAFGWSARVLPASSISTSEFPGGAVDSQGRLRVQVREPGTYYVDLRTPTDVGGTGVFRTPTLPVHRGDNPLPLDLSLGRIEGRSAAASEESQLTYSWRDSNGLTFSSTIRVDADGKFVLPYAPAGRGELARVVLGEEIAGYRMWHTLNTKSVAVPAGGTATVEAP
jgi:hypothetical protein